MLVPDVQEIIMISEFPNMFLEELLGLPTEQELEFSIELVSSIQLISKASYRMALIELVELKK